MIEVGCGAGWLCPSLAAYGRVTATDLSDEVLERARADNPEVEFVAGDFMSLPLPKGEFDVVVTLEVLPHVADQDAFVRKLADLLRPGGKLMLASQNRPVLERYNIVAPAKEGQLRRWLDREELHALLSRHLHVQELFAITPHADRGPGRVIMGRTGRKLLRSGVGRYLGRALAPRYGWTLMALAEKPRG